MKKNSGSSAANIRLTSGTCSYDTAAAAFPTAGSRLSVACSKNSAAAACLRLRYMLSGMSIK
jgi:hypothetical protein